jgi:hypothetical protein
MIFKPTSILISLLYFIINYFLYNYIFLSNLGLTITLFIFLEFIRKWGNEVPIKELILLLAASQWILGAKLSYNFGKTHHKYYMYVDESTYMGYVVPGFIAFSLGIYLITNNLKIKPLASIFSKDIKNQKQIAYTLIFIGLTSELISRFMNVPTLSFILYLLSILTYIGISYLFFIFPKYKYYLYLFAIGILFVLSLKSGMFHEFLVISTFLSFFIIPKNLNFIGKVTLIIGSVFLMYTIQIVKKDFRKIIWKSKNKNYIEVFFDLAEEELLALSNSEDNVKLEEENANSNNRLNQGWIISKVIYEVPKNKPFLGGETIFEAIEASLIPRFLAPNKVGAKQSIINFKRVTGIKLNRGTAMGLSIIAEFYANYGIVGGWISMFLYGLFLSILLRIIVNVYSSGSPLILLWLILFFFQVIKAETDLIKVINYITKSIILFYLIRFLFQTINLPPFLPLKSDQ